jgi:glucuronosyltransferase
LKIVFSLGKLPSVKHLEKNISVVLLNSHVSLTPPRPVVTGIVQVGGLHIKSTPSRLPDDVKEFLDGAQHGVVYFSLGNITSQICVCISKTIIFIRHSAQKL